MLTKEEFSKKILASEELKAKLEEASRSPAALKKFLEEQNCGFGVEEFIPSLKNPSLKSASELNDSDLDEVTGGTDNGEVVRPCIYCGQSQIKGTMSLKPTGYDMNYEITIIYTCNNPACTHYNQYPWE